MTRDAIAQALLAVAAGDDGDAPAAQAHLAAAQRDARRTARRDRQIVEIAALVIAGRQVRAAGLALEHAAEFPEDVELLADVTDAPRR
jgi:hypothetical protein